MTAKVTFSTATVDAYEIAPFTAIGSYSFECSMRCRCDTSSNIAALKALQGHVTATILMSGKTKVQTTGGTKATLTINGLTYANCYISALSWQLVPKSKPFTRYEYTIKFIQETA